MAVNPAAKTRLLFFNWAPFDDARGRGGGVTVYLRNLLDELSRRDDLDLSFLSAGMRYDRIDRRVRWTATENLFQDRGVRSYVIVNSPVRAPGRFMFDHVDAWRTDQVSRDVLHDFLTSAGPFDAVHIHNLEGISSAAAAVAGEFSGTRLYFTWHNYIPLCPEVHLLQGDARPCLDYENGRQCVGCIAPPLSARTLADRIVARPFRRTSAGERAAAYRSWRETNVRLLNEVFDGTMAVSSLARDTVVSLGMRPDRVRVVPLGMDMHRTPDEMRAAWAAKPGHDVFTFGYVGFRHPHKGLPFLAEALDRVPNEFLKRNADLVVAARLGWRKRDLLASLNKAFRKVIHIDGYERGDLGDIARRMDVNIAPSLWRETFHQIGYELLCLGTPSLLSSTVGLRMFFENKADFVFEAGNHADLVAKMAALAQNSQKLEAFWETPVRLPSMSDHAAELLEILVGGRTQLRR